MDTEDQRNQDQDWQNETTDPGGLFHIPGDQESLSEDNQTPAAPYDSTEDEEMPTDYPTTDTDQDSAGRYYAGAADEAGYDVKPEDHDDDVSPVELDHED